MCYVLLNEQLQPKKIISELEQWEENLPIIKHGETKCGKQRIENNKYRGYNKG